MYAEPPKVEKLIQQVFSIRNDNDFLELAISIFQLQYSHNFLFRKFSDLVGCQPEKVTCIEQIPFLPISFFKTHKVQTFSFEPETEFESSGTTGSTFSKHYIKNVEIYEKSFVKTFEAFYGTINQYCILALLPSYLERSNSSLIYMVKRLMNISGHPLNNFYLFNYKELTEVIMQLEMQNQKILLIGVTYALLEFAQQYPMKLTNTIIMETGGMKGRRRELIRSEVHEQLKSAFKVENIHSEYGMTELLSQAYSKKDGIFSTPPWMKILIYEEDDPLRKLLKAGATGGVNIIDLANIYSCSFISTEDIGRWYPDGSFEILGRFDNADVRGCNLMIL